MAWLPFTVTRADSDWENPRGASSTVEGCASAPVPPGRLPYMQPRTGRLYLACPPTETSKVRFLFDRSGRGRALVIVHGQLEGDTAWYWMGSRQEPSSGGWAFHPGEWHTFTLPTPSFPRGRLIGVRIYYQHVRTSFDYTGLLCGADYEVACGGPLVDICTLLYDVGTFFINLALDIADLWLIGSFLAAPFELLGELFQDGADTCCEVSAALQAILDALEGGITWDEIEALILEHIPELPGWLYDPVPYITDIVSSLIPSLPDWLDDPIAWFVENVLPLLPELPEWPEDPLEWLASVLEEHWPVLYYLAVDPEGEARYLIGQWFGWEPYQVSSWDLIFKAIMETWFPTLWELYLDPEGWIEEHAIGAIEKLLEPLREAVAALRGQLEELLEFVSDPLSWMWSWVGEWIEGALISDEDWEAEKGIFNIEAVLAEIDEVMPDVIDWAEQFLADEWED